MLLLPDAMLKPGSKSDTIQKSYFLSLGPNLSAQLEKPEEPCRAAGVRAPDGATLPGPAAGTGSQVMGSPSDIWGFQNML